MLARAIVHPNRYAGRSKSLRGGYGEEDLLLHLAIWCVQGRIRRMYATETKGPRPNSGTTPEVTAVRIGQSARRGEGTPAWTHAWHDGPPLSLFQQRESDSFSLQPKLTVNEPGDAYEQEADRVADRVMRMPDPTMVDGQHSSGAGLRLASGAGQLRVQRCGATPCSCSPEERAPHAGTEEELQRTAGTATGVALAGDVAGQGAPQVVHRTLGSPGRSLDLATRAFMEPRFGHDFGGVHVHDDSVAAESARAVGALAYTAGRDIVFGAGHYAPKTDAGQRLLAHELAHVVQQSGALNATVQRTPADSGSPSTGAPGSLASGVDAGTGSCASDTAHLDEIEKKYRAMVADARKKGYKVAADNLQRFLDGAGGTKRIDVTWLRTFGEVTEAERVNQQRFENSLTQLAKAMKDGETKTFSDHWDRMLTAGVTTELYYASGTSTVRSDGTFTLTRAGNIITIEGAVNHHWFDPYDWHEGLGAFIPGFGSISDDDALLMQKCRGARPFMMEADWQQTVMGTVQIRRWWFDSTDYKWSGP